MDFGNPALTLVSKNTNQIPLTYIQNVSKLVSWISLLQPIYGKNSKKILVSLRSKQILTDIGYEVFEVLPVTSSNNIFIKDIMKKMRDLGDSSTFCILFSAYLNKHLVSLIGKNVSRKEISSCLKDIRRKLGKLQYETKNVDISEIENIVGGVLKDELLINLFKKAWDIVYVKKEQKDVKKLVSELNDRIRIIKIKIGITSESEVLPGLIYKGVSKTSTKELKNCTTGVYNCSIDLPTPIAKGVLMFTTADQLREFSIDEEKEIEKTTNEITKNSNLIICEGKVENIHLQYLDNTPSLVFNVNSKHDIRRISYLFGGSISPLLKEIPLENCGHCDEAKIVYFGNSDYTWFKRENASVCTIVLRNSIDLVLDEYERLLKKAIQVIHKNLKDDRIEIVKAGGSFENQTIKMLEGDLEKKSSSQTLIHNSFIDALKEIKNEESTDENIYDVFNCKLKAVQYAIDISTIILETQDQFSVREELSAGASPSVSRDFQ